MPQRVRKLRLKNRYAIILLILAGIGLFGVVVSMSYAFFTHRVESSDLVFNVGTLQVTFDNNGNVINLTKEYPKTNTQGLSTTGYNFNIRNTGSIDAKYLVRLELDPTNTLPLEYVKLSYTKTKENNNETDNPNSDPVLVSNLNATQTFITNQVIEAGKTDGYNLKLWIDYSAPNDIQGKTFKAKIVVDAIQNVEDGYAMASTSPIIELNKFEDGQIDQIIKKGSTFTDPGVLEVKDDKDKLTPSDVTVTGSVNTAQVGTYDITYQVTDSDNNTTTVIRTVAVDDGTLVVYHSVDEVVNSFTNEQLTGKEVIMCSHIYGNGDLYLGCKPYDTIDNAYNAKNHSVIILVNDITRSDWVLAVGSNKNLIIELNGYTMKSTNGSTFGVFENSKAVLNNKKQTGGVSSNAAQSLNIAGTGEMVVNNVNVTRTGTGNAAIWIGSQCDGCKLTLNNVNINSSVEVLRTNGNDKNAVITINGGSYIANEYVFVICPVSGNNTPASLVINDGTFTSTTSSVIYNTNTGKININKGYFKSEDNSTISMAGGNITINGEEATFDNNGNYISGTYIYGNGSNQATVYQVGGKLVVNGGTIYHGNAENGTWRQHALRMEGGTAYLNGGTFESLGTQIVPAGGAEHTVYLNQGDAIVYLNGAKINGTLRINYNANVVTPNTTAYVCSGQLNSLSIIDGAHAYIKSTGVTWQTPPTFGTYIIQDDNITCSE